MSDRCRQARTAELVEKLGPSASLNLWRSSARSLVTSSFISCNSRRAEGDTQEESSLQAVERQGSWWRWTRRASGEKKADRATGTAEIVSVLHQRHV